MKVSPNQDHQEPLSKEKLRLWLKLLRTSRHIEGTLRDRLRDDFGTTLPRFDVLAALYRAPDGLKMSQLSRALMVSNGNVTGIVDRLVKDGLIVRVPIKGDRRAMLVQLTETGTEEFKTMATRHEQWLDVILGSMPDDDVVTMMALLDRMQLDDEVPK